MSKTNTKPSHDVKLFNALIKATDNGYAALAEDGGADITGFIDSGSTSLNALMSGSIRGGYPKNKITGLAGDPSTGKTFFMLQAVAAFLRDNVTGFAFLYDSEFNLSKSLLISRGIDPKRAAIVPVETIEEFRTQATKVVDKYLEIPKDKRPPMFMALDSLGMLSTRKEMEDIAAGKDVVDMTKARLVKGTFRSLTTKLGKADVPMIVTNHTYQTIGMFSTKKMGGGTGLEYAASTIIFLAKKKDKEGSGMDAEVVGVEIIATLKKSRNTIENKKVETYLSYSDGLDPYYGLLDIAVDAGVIKKLTRGDYELPDGVIVNSKDNPETYFTDELLDTIDAACLPIFTYSKVEDEEKGLTNTEE